MDLPHFALNKALSLKVLFIYCVCVFVCMCSCVCMKDRDWHWKISISSSVTVHLTFLRQGLLTDPEAHSLARLATQGVLLSLLLQC